MEGRYILQVIKKDGTLEEYNEQKIINAINKSANRALYNFTPKDYEQICNTVFEEINTEDFDDDKVPISFIHSVVEKTLLESFPDVGRCYQQYRNYKLDFVHMMDEVYEKSQSIMYIGDKDNANTDSTLVATKRSLIFNVLNKELYKRFFMTQEELQACNDGYIYIHDMSARRDTFNCGLFNMSNVMRSGFEMGNVWYNEPNSLDTAFDVMGDIILSAAAQQYGGFTVPEVDKVLEPYAKKTYDKQYKKYFKLLMGDKRKTVKTLGINWEEISSDSMKEMWEQADEDSKNESYYDIQRDFEQGWQGIEYKLNTVGSSRGDYPFVTMSLGLATSRFGKMAAITLLNVHAEGQGKKGFKRPVLFPKIVFLYDKELHGDGSDKYPNADVFNAGIECSSKTMYPDWLSLTGNGYVAEMYKKYKKVVSPMGKCKSAHVKRYSTVA